MKKIVLFICVIALAGSYSCKKTYTCYCFNYVEAADTSYHGSPDTSFTIQARNSTQAVNNCYWQTINHNANCVFE